MNRFFTTERDKTGDIDVFTVKSTALGHRADLSVYKPAGNCCDIPVVILLHGVYGSHWAWSLKAKVHETLQALIVSKKVRPMLLVMPSDGLFQDGSGYLKHHTADYEKWIVEDIVDLVKENYEEVSDASPMFLAGLSMGGYGALRLGAKYPNVFKAFSGLSAITKFEQMGNFVEDLADLKLAVLKEENVLEVMLENKKTLPPFRFDCGENDPLFAANVTLHEALEENGISHEFYANAGEHNWDYWQQNIAESLIFFNEQL